MFQGVKKIAAGETNRPRAASVNGGRRKVSRKQQESRTE
jgi:hypothetical protein